MKKILLIVVSILFIFPINVFAEDLKLAENAKASIIMEASTGEILYKNNINEKYAPASMTKMMSLLLVMEYIEEGGMTLDEMVTVSENASNMGGSQIFLKTGEKMSVSDLLKGVTIASANDVVVSIKQSQHIKEKTAHKPYNLEHYCKF